MGRVLEYTKDGLMLLLVATMWFGGIIIFTVLWWMLS